jgi:flagellar assembly factor FliW
MKLASENKSAIGEFQISIPAGLIGMPKLNSFSIALEDNGWPFMHLKSAGGQEVQFVVIDPGAVIQDYEIELSDEDAELLDIKSAADAMVLNIVTVHSLRPQYVTANLIGPLVINRHTGVGKQVIVMSWNRVSATYPLIDERGQKNAA